MVSLIYRHYILQSTFLTILHRPKKITKACWHLVQCEYIQSGSTPGSFELAGSYHLHPQSGLHELQRIFPSILVSPCWVWKGELTLNRCQCLLCGLSRISCRICTAHVQRSEEMRKTQDVSLQLISSGHNVCLIQNCIDYDFLKDLLDVAVWSAAFYCFNTLILVWKWFHYLRKKNSLLSV